MVFEKEKYKKRLMDKKIKRYLKVFGAISVEGPKWCGKTWTSLANSKSNISLTNKADRDKVELDSNFALAGTKPRLIDEWNLLPFIWDDVRNKCDELTEKGNYILTCSTKLTDDKQKKQVKHSGAGRIGKVNLRTMSLFESGDSSGNVSIMGMYNGTQKNTTEDKVNILKLANLIVRGGWPANINVDENDVGLLPKSYIENILESDMNDDKKRDKNKMTMLMRSLARNESTIANNNTLLKDIETNYDDTTSIHTIEDYLNALERLHMINNQLAYTENYRSPERVGKTSKRHFADPSLACACLNLNKERLLNDLNTFGFMFEALCERDLDIYMNYLNGNLYHFRDNVSGLEVDSILEFENGDYAAIEIKLGFNEIEAAKKSLIKFSDNMKKKPKFMGIIVGNIDATIIDKETGIYIFPITALKP